MKTGKIQTDVDYIQSSTTSLEVATGTELEKDDFTPTVGMVRYNTTNDNVELYTLHGWFPILTQDEIANEGQSLRDGISDRIKQVKKSVTGTLHFQGGTGGGRENYFNETKWGPLPEVALEAPWSIKTNQKGSCKRWKNYRGKLWCKK